MRFLIIVKNKVMNLKPSVRRHKILLQFHDKRLKTEAFYTPLSWSYSAFMCREWIQLVFSAVNYPFRLIMQKRVVNLLNASPYRSLEVLNCRLKSIFCVFFFFLIIFIINWNSMYYLERIYVTSYMYSLAIEFLWFVYLRYFSFLSADAVALRCLLMIQWHFYKHLGLL